MESLEGWTLDEAAIIDYIRKTYPDADILTAGSGTFFSLDPDKHWPNFATLVTSDDYDSASNLSRSGIYRLNIGVSTATFERLVGSMPDPTTRPSIGSCRIPCIRPSIG